MSGKCYMTPGLHQLIYVWPRLLSESTSMYIRKHIALCVGVEEGGRNIYPVVYNLTIFYESVQSDLVFP